MVVEVREPIIMSTIDQMPAGIGPLHAGALNTAIALRKTHTTIRDAIQWARHVHHIAHKDTSDPTKARRYHDAISILEAWID